MSVMTYRRPTEQDYLQMVELQHRNLFEVLAPEQRGDGFLSTAFTAAQFQAMNQSVGVVVGVAQNRVQGYLCAAALEFPHAPFPAAAVRHAASVPYQGKALTQYRTCLVNPICIDQDHRGSDLFMGLCQAMLSVLAAADYEIALAFVSTANTRSLQACQKMMKVVSQFEENQHRFAFLMRDLR